MTEEELKELFSDMLSKDIKPMLSAQRNRPFCVLIHGGICPPISIFFEK